MSHNRLSSLLALPLLAVGLAGCADDDPPPPPPPPDTTPPHVADIVIPEWPPRGPGSSISVRATDDRALSSVTASFRGVATRPVSGPLASVDFRAEELGEGYGTLVIRACDTRLACVDRSATGFLVDLTPPEIDEDRLVASPHGDGVDGELSFWVGDAWVLGSVEVTYAGKRFVHELPHAYPKGVGSQWDVTRIAVPAASLPDGQGDAVVVARDAAGNVRTRRFSVRVDGKAPVAAVVAPADGASVSGPFVVHARGVDDGPRPVSLDVFVGGSLVGTFDGPEAAITIDTATLPKGPLAIRVVATDEAGNKSESARARVTVE